MTKRLLGRVAGTGATLMLLALLAATPVLAVSMITNELSINPASFGDSRSVDTRAHTHFDQFGIFNPYNSNFVVAINYRHLRSPSIYYRVAANGSYVYKSSIGELDNQAGYLFDNGGNIVVTPYHSYIYATFRSTTSCPTRTAKNWHGQTAPWWNSWGVPAEFWTTHTSC